MKFGRRIKGSRYSEWADQYVDYSALKKQIKNNLPWTDTAEAEFIVSLRKELEKCETFQRTKAEEINSRIDSLEKEVVSLVAKAAAADSSDDDSSHHHQDHRTPRDTEAAVNSYRDDDGGSDDDDVGDDEEDDHISLDEIEERFKELEEEVAVLVADVHDLALFTKLNFTGFIKIVKKHDKLTGFALKPTFNKDFLEQHPFYKMNYDPVIVKLSKLFDLVRTRGHPVEGDSSAGGNQNAFVRSTTKYWVHEENIVPLKLNILKHLPVLVFDTKKEFNVKDSAITSIYYDNEELELYLGRLEKTEGAEAIRMRWYGDVDGKVVFVERKTHREDWTGEKSVKERFTIKEDKLNDFCAGRYTMDEEFDALVKKGKKTEKEVEGMKQLADEIQYAIVTRNLRPVMRSFYNRTAFQLPGNATVRISLDTELTLVREDNFDGNDRTHGNWRRTDFGIDYPFPTVKKEDKEIFPYGILEVKLATRVGEEPPQWIRDLVNSHLVEAVPKFSKFIHGCATLLPERVDLVPFWLPQMDQDIRKPVSSRSRVLIERPTSVPTSGEHSNAGESPVIDASTGYNEPVSEGEEDEYLVNTAAEHDEDRLLRLPPEAQADAKAAREHRERKLRENGKADDSGFQRPTGKGQYDRALRVDPLTPSNRFDLNVSAVDAKLAQAERDTREDAEEAQLEADEDDDPAVTLTREFRAPPGKRIAIPVRIEPKVIFAAERTFLKWMNFAVLLSMVSIALMNFISADDSVGIIASACFTFSALLATAYSGYMYVLRILRIRDRRAINYHDKWGPTFLCFTVIASVVINLVLRVLFDQK
ncbi:vacuole fusion, non-autophagic-related protein [Trichosporon asahii var. asahii CBS 8904]|uniref:Vacuolar transporter chaperone complex subunit 4 n=1 Tax=Trichosporon asahii var. asahii (strain CBS 8904) TaxID=1220162 RepID=K1VAD7_TRIAC|nr:vacuole fusion, non-autophagic-related protein [Trichosporon asahii var. asahii CBS 8904]